MQRWDEFDSEQPTAPAANELVTEERGGPALYDAGESLSRIEADEAAAAAARSAYMEAGLPVLKPDEAIARELRADERLHARRAPAFLNRVDTAGASGADAGSLYLTSHRLVHVGPVIFSIGLPDIEELVIAGERLLLSLSGGHGVSLDVAEPQLLRVQIGAARGAPQQ
jgi:hypothetical protein